MDIEQVGKIEKGLGIFMTPIDPDPDFIQKLGSRLRNAKLVSIEGQPLGGFTTLMVVLAGLIVGMISLILIRWLRRL